MDRSRIIEVLSQYDKERLTIATLGSHSALNILRGAKDEGFRTICLCRERERIIYESFGVADEIIELGDYSDLLDKSMQDELIEKNAIIIPHGTFNAYIGRLDELRVPVFGNRVLMLWEVDREKQRKWLLDAGLTLPRTFERPEDIDRLVIVKYPGAKGGMGYFLASSPEEFYEKAKQMVEKGLIDAGDVENAHIQEYIVGANVYFSFFYSPVFGRVELIAVDRRYESSADGLGRIPAEQQLKAEITPTYTVIGNFPVVLRESLLAQAIKAARSVVEVSKQIAYPGMVGPFCLEAVFDENARMVVFEISARIVAGSNVGIPASPYSYVLFGEPMYMGRRIAREIRLAAEKNMLEEVIY
ncbi:formate--phosphoribosylaminoimidazolecarboxamide ligase [Archaeoglobus veneficus]|uniref:5-formaminoimidazole-4-carboxamide-1-(beta)-D-ribofuranosyl 5'-monophosphate synthetase n=1 Tax=Archaeoglobus veneficus (strain DSM 11195 / SNP6) TaxID=693661 RepID=F2KQP9_ARCVS|nr:formate--phosphoribosylaminoimidazolecarboxamide ligase [Archaeoglobus veneficus]AEA46611.1 5-formaminoimidazole-4-carboxamide-1-(beta)-D- ribofuranosyl 5'-monophosphate synthetase [Archaeoglobus veneficus SNP6]